jgi:hypothetical protein
MSPTPIDSPHLVSTYWAIHIGSCSSTEAEMDIEICKDPTLGRLYSRGQNG